MQRLLLALAAGVALGLLVFLIGLSQAFDAKEHNARLETLRNLKTVDSRFNAETLSARLNVDPNSTALVDFLPSVQKAMVPLVKGPTALRGLTTPAVDKAVNQYVAAMNNKVAAAKDFEYQSLLLAQSIETVRAVSDRIAKEAFAAGEQADLKLLVLKAAKAAMEYGLLPSPPNGDEVANMAAEVSKIAPLIENEDLQYEAVLFGSRTNSILSERESNDKMLRSILQAPTDKALVAVQVAYDAYHQQRLDQAEFFRRILIGYAAALLLGVAYMGFRLRGSYLALNQANAQLAESNVTLEQKVAVRTQDLSKAYDALKTSQAAVVQSEKMASLGQMVAGVTHEINTPLGYVKGNFELVQGMFADLRRLVNGYAHAVGLIRTPDAPESEVNTAFETLAQTEAEVDPILFEEAGQLLEDSAHGLEQIGELVVNLKNFSRLDRSRLDLFDINKGLDSTLNICKHMLKDRIVIHKEYGRLPEIQCAPSQINQVFLNLVTNATQAISDKGEIHIITRVVGDNIEVRVEDTGCGMSPEVLAKIYEPFFTTKEVGKGTGLGMSIVFQIVREHGGRIECKSEVGKGTRFILTLPQRQRPANDEAATGLRHG